MNDPIARHQAHSVRQELIHSTEALSRRVYELEQRVAKLEGLLERVDLLERDQRRLERDAG